MGKPHCTPERLQCRQKSPQPLPSLTVPGWSHGGPPGHTPRDNVLRCHASASLCSLSSLHVSPTTLCQGSGLGGRGQAVGRRSLARTSAECRLPASHTPATGPRLSPPASPRRGFPAWPAGVSRGCSALGSKPPVRPPEVESQLGRSRGASEKPQFPARVGLSCVATRQARRRPPGPVSAAQTSWATGSAGSWLPLWPQTPGSPGSYKAGREEVGPPGSVP